jgi:hypothetical protein
MWDQRFVAVHRGGPLEVCKQQRLAAWAAGHAVATAHAADHCLGAVVYGLKAVGVVGVDRLRAGQAPNQSPHLIGMG